MAPLDALDERGHFSILPSLHHDHLDLVVMGYGDAAMRANLANQIAPLVLDLGRIPMGKLFDLQKAGDHG